MVAVASALERGLLRGPLFRLMSAGWGRIASAGLTRPLQVPSRTRVVTVGGATLGGSGKTPLAIACAAEFARAGVRVAFVGHAYRAIPRRAHVVQVDDVLAEVGDEALIAARALAPVG